MPSSRGRIVYHRERRRRELWIEEEEEERQKRRRRQAGVERVTRKYSTVQAQQNVEKQRVANA